MSLWDMLFYGKSNKMKIVCEGCKVKFDSEKELNEHRIWTSRRSKKERAGKENDGIMMRSWVYHSNTGKD